MENFRGKVIKGASRGKSLGFPTANISVHKAIDEGIYLSKIIIRYSSRERSESRSKILKPQYHSVRGRQVQDDEKNSSRQARTITYNALTFIGAAKTFGETKVQAESYLLDFSGDLYGKYISVQLLRKLRDNQKFKNAEDLKKQMQEDLVNARKFFLEWC